MNIGKRLLIIVALLFLIVAVAGWTWWRSPSSCSAKKSATGRVVPTVSMASVNITGISENRIRLTSKMKIANPLPFELHANGLKYEIFIESIRVLQAAYKQPLSNRSEDSTVIELPMELLAKPLTKVLGFFDRQKIYSADYAVKTTLRQMCP